jgi:hypothetical protein
MTKNFQELDSVKVDNLETSQDNDNFLSGDLTPNSQTPSRVVLQKALFGDSEKVYNRIVNTQKMLTERANPPAPEKIPFIETLGAALLDTPVANYAAKLLNGEYLVEKENPNYNAYPEIKGTEYEQHWEYFLDANGPEDTIRLKRKIDRENAVRDTLASSSIAASLVAGVLTLPLDPVNFLPIGGQAYRAVKAGKFFAGAGKTAAAGFLSTSVSEAALQADQITRTAKESTVNIAAGTVLSGILGGAASLLSKEKFDKLALETQKNIQDEGPVFGFNEKGDLLQSERDGEFMQGSVGAMRSPIPRSQRTSAQDEALYAGKGKIAGAVAFFSRKLSPIQEILNTDGVLGKRAMQGLVKNNMFTNKNIEGGIANAISTENALKLYDAGLARAIKEGRTNYKKFSDGLLEQQGKNKFTAPFNIKATMLRHDEFNSKVYGALISGDVHEIPEVEATAKSYRKNVFEPIRKKGIEAGIFDEDVSIENATSYLMIQYDRNKIIAQEPEFRKFIAKQVEENLIPKIQKDHADRQASLTAKSQATFNQIKILEKELGDIKDQNELAAKAKGKAERRSETLFSQAAGDTPLKDEDLVRILDSYKAAAKTIREEAKPKNLTDFIRSRGGIFDKSGRVNALFSARNRKPNGVTAKEKISDINGEKVNSDMKTIIDHAWREGYFPEYDAPPKTMDFLAALEDELDGVDIRYTAKDLDDVDKIQQAKEFLNQVGDFGIDIGKIKDAKTLRETQIGGKSFKDILLKKEISVLKKRLAEIDGKISERRIKFDAVLGDDPITYAEEITNELVRKLRNIEHQGVIMPYDMKIGVRGPAKERTLNFIKHSDLKPWTVQNVEKLARDYTRILGTDIELSKRFGDLNLEKVQAEISDEYDVLRAKSPTEKDRLRLDKQEREVKQTLMDLKNIVRGNYGRVDRPDSFWPTVARTSRNMAYVQKMGSVVQASLIDPVHLIFRHGLGRFLNTGLKPLITNLKGFKLASKDTAFIGQASEAILHSRASSWSDFGNPYSSKSKLENLSISLVDTMSKLNLLNVWTDATKKIASVISQQRISEEVVKLAKLYEDQYFELGQGLKDVDLSKSPITKKSRAYLALLGIDEKNVRQIVGELQDHSTKINGLTILNLEKWTSRDAVDAMSNALNLDIDSSIITRGIGEVPTLIHTEIGKTFLQFKSFLLAANQQILIRGLQQADAAVLQGIVSMVTMGMLVSYLQKITKGEEISDDPNVWLYEGVDRSGLLPIIMEVNGYADLMGVGIGNALEVREPSRQPGSAVISRAGGPSIGMVKDLGDLGASTVRKIKGDGDYTESDQRKAIKMLPYNNLFYLRGLFSLLDDSEKSE